MAKKTRDEQGIREEKGAGGQGPGAGDRSTAVPSFTLRADQAGHLRALMAVADILPASETGEVLRTLREFELYADERRG